MSVNTVSWNRRQFLGNASTAAIFLQRLRAERGDPAPWDGPAIVKKVYMGGRPSWPRPDVDLKQDISEVEARLAEVEKRCPGQVRFTGGEMVTNAAEMAKWLESARDADAILAFNMVTIVWPMLRTVAESGMPVLMFSIPYAGHDWTHAAALMQKGARLELIASSDFTELDAYVPLLRSIHHLRHSQVALLSPPGSRPKSEGYTRQFGTQFAYPSYQELKAIYDASNVSKAAGMAEEFTKAAVKVVEPSREEIVSSMRLALAIDTLLAQLGANAIAIDCLGGFGRKELPAYPCVAFSRLNDEGRYGVCECDLESTMTQLLVTSFSGRPGFVSDPVFDTSRNEVIHAHCVSATKMKGIGGDSCPYLVRSHLEDHKGVSMQVLTPAGEPVTVAKFVNAAKMMVSGGEALGNVDNERGCRTKIRTKVRDARVLLANWGAAMTGGEGMPGTRDLLHRVVFYGDHRTGIERLGRLTGFQVLQEDAVRAV